MAKTTLLIFEIKETDIGQRIFTVQSREGESGECPPYHTLHNSLSAADALGVLRRAAKAAVSGDSTALLPIGVSRI